MKHATKEGTFHFLKQFPKYSRDFYRYDGDVFLSSLGIGTFRKEPYREENYLINYKDAIKTAVLQGINLIDTAINYRYQISEQEIGEALHELFTQTNVSREQLVITSKAGFIPLEFPFPKDPYAWIQTNIIEASLATKEEVVIDQHCMSPAYLRWSVERSLENLGIQTLDILFLHNPETQLGYIDRTTFQERVKQAFALFEELVKEEKIRHYGVACWNGFLYDEEHTEYISLQEIVAIAKEVGGDGHHLKYIQSPYNLVKSEAMHYQNQQGPDGKYYTLVQALNGYGLKMIGSSSLLQMNLFKGKFRDTIAKELATEDFGDVISALQFARAGVMSALFGAVDPEHVKANALLAYLPNPKPQNIQKLFGEKDAL